jgi:hypothetical protein
MRLNMAHGIPPKCMPPFSWVRVSLMLIRELKHIAKVTEIH